MIRKVEVRTTKCPLLGNLVLLGKKILGGKRKKKKSLGLKRQQHERNPFLLLEMLEDGGRESSR